MADKEYIEREAFLADKKWLYCTDCDKRKGKKRGKMVTLYEIGEAPCKSCGIHDMLEEVEEYPAADAIEELQKRVPKRPHGRLGDLDALIEKVIVKYLEHERKGELVFAAAEVKQDIVDLISDAPTIIQAEEGE